MLSDVELDKVVESEGVGVSRMDMGKEGDDGINGEGDTVTETLDVKVHVASPVGERVIDIEGDLARVGVREDDFDLVIVPDLVADTD